MQPSFEVRNYRGFRHGKWSPHGVCLLVGPNGAGKSTLLELIEFFRVAFQQGIPQAGNLKGMYGLKHFDARPDEPLTLSMEFGRARWDLEIAFQGTNLHQFQGETYSFNGAVVASRPPLTPHATVGNPQLFGGMSHILRAVAESNDGATHGAVDFVKALQGGRSYRNFNQLHLQAQGSQPSGDLALAPDGLNVFAVLRTWSERREHRHRYQWVLEGLREAFPDLCDDIDFDTGNNIVSVRFFRAGRSEAIPARLAPNGLLIGLLQLCAVASSERYGIISIDEVENSLHPFAIRKLIGRFREWSEENEVTIGLSTHSPVVLDEFKDEPDKVFVLERNRSTQPVLVNDLLDPEWLAQFSLGRLYSHGDFGSPVASPGGQNGVATH